MEELLVLEMSNKELNGLPLFYNKVHYNPLVSINEEQKTYVYNQQVQSTIMRSQDPQIDISKTVNYLLLDK